MFLSVIAIRSRYDIGGKSNADKLKPLMSYLLLTYFTARATLTR